MTVQDGGSGEVWILCLSLSFQHQKQQVRRVFLDGSETKTRKTRHAPLQPHYPDAITSHWAPVGASSMGSLY